MIANLTHYDLDGIVSYLVLRKKYGDTISPYFTGYFKIDKMLNIIITKIKEFEKIYITDLSLNKNQINFLQDIKNNHNVSFQIYDHHLEDKKFNNNKNIIIDTSQCGAKITYDYEIKNQIEVSKKFKNLIYLTNIFDLWKEDDKYFDIAYKLNTLFYIYDLKWFILKFRNGFKKFDKQDIDVLSNYKNKVNLFIKKLQKENKFILNNRVLSIINFSNKVEYINDINLKYKKDFDIFLYFTIVNNNQIKISYRSRKIKFKNYIDSLKKYELNFFNNYVKNQGGHEFVGGINVETTNIKDIEKFINIAKIIIKEG